MWRHSSTCLSGILSARPNAMFRVAIFNETSLTSASVLFVPSECGPVGMLLLRGLRRWWQYAVQPQIDRLRSIVVVPVIAQGDQCSGARRLPVPKQRQRIAQLRIIHARQRRAAILEGSF